jgi:hypothetical protein
VLAPRSHRIRRIASSVSVGRGGFDIVMCLTIYECLRMCQRRSS